VAVKCLNPNLLVPDGGMGSITKVSAKSYFLTLHVMSDKMWVNGLWSQRQLACERALLWCWHSCDVAVKCLNPNLLVPDGGMGSITKVSIWAVFFGRPICNM
jgi:hypothetical protein